MEIERFIYFVECFNVKMCIYIYDVCVCSRKGGHRQDTTPSMSSKLTNEEPPAKKLRSGDVTNRSGCDAPSGKQRSMEDLIDLISSRDCSFPDSASVAPPALNLLAGGSSVASQDDIRKGIDGRARRDDSDDLCSDSDEFSEYDNSSDEEAERSEVEENFWRDMPHEETNEEEEQEKEQERGPSSANFQCKWRALKQSVELYRVRDALVICTPVQLSHPCIISF